MMSEWISVEDRLPPYEKVVMGCSVSPYKVFDCLFNPRIGWRGRNNTSSVLVYYWMPLPEPPEDSDE